MTLPHLVAALLASSAAASYLNHRFVKLPSTIGLMAFAFVGSLLAMGYEAWAPLGPRPLTASLAQVDFRTLVLDGLLPFLLFAGGLQFDARRLRGMALTIATLDTVGVAVATLASGALFWAAGRALGIEVTLLQGLLFGALIAPTDPIAVLGILRSAEAPRPLETTMAGESLFNDGVGIVLFAALAGAALGAGEVTAGALASAFAYEGLGALALGGALAWAAVRLTAKVDDFPLEIFLSLALASGAWALADVAHASGPLAAAGAGLVMGSYGRRVGLSEKTQGYLDAFWTVLDEILNAVLFMLLGLELLVIEHDARLLVLGAAAIPIVLLARLAGVAPIVLALRRVQPICRGAIPVLTWGGLRGGISVALALSLPAGEVRDILLTATYVVVAFSVLVQGPSLGSLVRRTAR